MECKLTGYEFRNSTAKPVGQVILRKEENKFDPMAIAVYYGEEHIGYLKKGSPEQEFVFEQITKGVQPKAEVLEYKFGYKDGGSVVFNDNHEGILYYVKLKIEGHIGYIKDGKEYISITNVLKLLGSSLGNIIRWAITNFKTYDEYTLFLQDSATKGTEMHDKIEKFLQGKGDGFTAIKNFCSKYSPKVIGLEQVVYSAFGVAGRYDAFLEIDGKKIMIDWKSSKKPQLKHQVQTAFNAVEAGADEGWVVTFGGIQKQGFGVCKVKDIKKYHEVVKNLSKINQLLT